MMLWGPLINTKMINYHYLAFFVMPFFKLPHLFCRETEHVSIQLVLTALYICM